MKLEVKDLKKKYKDYYECPYNCGAVYHVSCINNRDFECRDCKNVAKAPEEIKIRERIERKRA